MQNWQDAGLFHDTKFILPSAPHIPVTSANGHTMPAWFDIAGARGPHVSFADLSRQPQDEQRLLHSRDYLVELIKAETTGSGNGSSSETTTTTVPLSQVVLGGFSQGGVMALLTGVTSGLRLGGVFCLSGYLALAEAVRTGGDAEKFARAEDTSLPILMSIGDRDPVINPEWARESAEIVRGLGYEVDLTVVPYVGCVLSSNSRWGSVGWCAGAFIADFLMAFLVGLFTASTRLCSAMLRLSSPRSKGAGIASTMSSSSSASEFGTGTCTEMQNHRDAKCGSLQSRNVQV